MTRCPCHPLGIHYFIWMRIPGSFCIDCGELRKDAIKGTGGSEILCGRAA